MAGPGAQDGVDWKEATLNIMQKTTVTWEEQGENKSSTLHKVGVKLET